MTKVTNTQLEYLQKKLNKIVDSKVKKHKEELIEEAYQWLVKHPFKIKKPEFYYCAIDYCDNFIDKGPFQKFRDTLYEKQREVTDKLEAKRDEILDRYVLGEEDILKAIKELEDM